MDMEYVKKAILLKNGKTCVIRQAEETDAERMIEYLSVTAKETPFLGREPEDVPFTMEQERDIIQKMNAAERDMMLLAEVDGVHAGNANLGCVRDRSRFRHRCTMGVGLYRAFWSMGIGTALLGELLAAAKSAGYEQAELEVISTNEAAIGLYKKFGFEVTGTHPHAMRYRDGTYGDFLFMVKRLS